jgi:osmotically inducible lipoprotein OsmB
MFHFASQPRAFTAAVALTSILILSGCGTDPTDRAVSGAAIGAGAGAIIGAAAGSPGTGAAIGAVGGAALGAATDPCDLDLGAPYWRDHGGRDEYDRRCSRRHRD